MRFGLVVGFALGYYLGAKAGRERYDQIRRVLRGATPDRVVRKGRAVVDLTVERFRDGSSRSPAGRASSQVPSR